MAWGTAAYGILAGLSAGVGFLFVVMGLRRGLRWSPELALGVLAFAAAGATLATLALHSSESTQEYQDILHGPFSYIGISTLIAISWTVGVTERLWYPRIPVALTGIAMIAISLDALSSGALIADEVSGFRTVHLFGEAFVVHTPSHSSLQPVLIALLGSISAYFVAAFVARRQSARPVVDPLSIGIAIAWLMTLYDLLVDEGIVGTSYLQPFGLVAFVCGLAIQHSSAVIETERRLIRQSATLENIVASRTAALRAAHEDLLSQLSVQNRSALRLAKLSEMFLSLSTVSSADDDVDDVLAEAIGCLAGLLDASDGVLTWHPAGAEQGAIMRVDWAEPHAGVSVPSAGESIDRTLNLGGQSFGRLTIRRRGSEGFSAEHRRLVDLTADFLASVLLRFELESSHVSTAVNRERHRIARELHDSLSQRLYAAAFNADAISQSAASEPQIAIDGAAQIRQLVLSTLSEIRTLLYELQPEVLNERILTDLVAQLSTSVAEIYQRPIELVVAHSGPSIPTEQKLALYRIVQESLGNALRHAEATNIKVTVDVDLERARVEVGDDGRGFVVDEVRTGHGLRNIRDRAAEAGIELSVISSPDSGTSVSATWSRQRSNILDLTVTPSLETAS
ncbi:MAG: sensor histidine kinase [Acidimicrobiales bacterium]